MKRIAKLAMVFGLSLCVLIGNSAFAFGATSSARSSPSSASRPSVSKPSISLSKQPSTITTPKVSTPVVSKPSTTSPTASKSTPIVSKPTTSTTPIKGTPVISSVNSSGVRTYSQMQPYSISRTPYYYGGSYHPAFVPAFYSPYWYNPMYWSGSRPAPMATSARSYIGGFIINILLLLGFIYLCYWLYKRYKDKINISLRK